VKRIGLKGFIIAVIICWGVFSYVKHYRENQLLKKIIARLSADSRVAEVLVTDVKFDPATRKNYTTIKFLEYDAEQKALPAKYFTFSGDIIQFQSMVIRFDDFYVQKEHPLKGKSAYIFMKAFILAYNGAEAIEINKVNAIPSGYQVESARSSFEKKLWQRFWDYALSPQQAKRIGVKNAQIEAPGTKFIPGMLYTIKIEHDGGLRIDAQPLPSILKDEQIKF
jgi:hypothetical protein